MSHFKIKQFAVGQCSQQTSPEIHIEFRLKWLDFAHEN